MYASQLPELTGSLQVLLVMTTPPLAELPPVPGVPPDPAEVGELATLPPQAKPSCAQATNRQE